MSEHGDGYTFDVLWRAGDGSMIRRRYELVEDPDGQPAGVLVTEEPYDPHYIDGRGRW